jgi:hypothetical protein
MRTFLFSSQVCAVALALISVAAAGCGSDDDDKKAAAPGSATPTPPPTHLVSLDGQVYDGLTGARLTAYAISLDYAAEKKDGTVAGDTGKFLIADLPVYQDYTITIIADGYRPFRSHNAMFNIPNPDNNESPSFSSRQTYYYDAYLFPVSIHAPAVSFTVRKATSAGELVGAGKARLRPTSASVVADTTAETPAGVGAQLWTNDEDLQAKPVSKDVVNGKIDIAENELVYGVRYLVNIFDVAGYQPFETTITAGTDSSKTLVLNEELTDPLTVVSQNPTCVKPVTPNDTVASLFSLEFNQDVEFATTTLPGGFPELVDSQFSMTSTNTDVDANFNTLATNLSTSALERGTTTVCQGKTLTVSWNPSVGLATKDVDDAITQVRWNLNGIQVQPVGKPSQKISLTTLYPNASFITCN